MSYALGELRAIDVIDALRSDDALLSRAREAGFRRYAVADVDSLVLAAGVARQSLARAQVDPDQIDLVVYATVAPGRAELFTRTRVLDVALDLGLVRAEPVGLFLVGCTGAAMALKIARALLVQEHHQRALVVCTDVTAPAGPRLLASHVAVLSDAASAFVVERDSPGDWQVLAIATSVMPSLVRAHPYRFLSGQLECLSDVFRRVFDEAGVAASDCSRVVMNNLGVPTCRLFVGHIGFDASRCFVDNVGRFGHAYASDPLINLVDAEAAAPLRVGEVALLLGNAETSWGAILLRKCAR